MTTCLVGHPSIEATHPAGHHLARHLAGERLRIATATAFASHLDIQDYTGHQDYQQPPS